MRRFGKGATMIDERPLRFPRAPLSFAAGGAMDVVMTYAGPVIAVLGAVIALLFDKKGKPARPNWIAWFAFGAMLVGTGISVYRTHAARLAEAAARAEAEAARNREAAGQRTMLGGFDFSRPFESGSFYFDVGTGADGAPPRAEGFVGPFPALGAGASGLLVVNVRDGFYYEFRLEPMAGGLRLINADGHSRPYELRAAGSNLSLEPAGTPAGQRTHSRHAGEPLSGGEWVAAGEDNEFAYHLGLASPEPLRRIVSGLSGSREHGRLTLLLPGASEARKAAIAEAYRQIRPYFVFYAPFASGTPGAQDCVSRIRVPMEMRRLETGEANALVLQIAATREGFQTETCETAYLP
jgi:hypothetical protein